MVLSVAAKAALKIAAKKAAIARTHRIKKKVRHRVKKIEVKRTEKEWLALEMSKRGKPIPKDTLNRLSPRPPYYNKKITKAQAMTRPSGYTSIRRSGYVAASDTMSDSDLKRNLVGTSKDGIYHTGLETSRIHTAPAARTRVYVPPPKGNLQDKELFRILPPKQRLPPWSRPGPGARRQGAWFQGPPPPDTWKGILTDKESLGLAVPTSVAFTSVFWASRSHAQGKTLTGKDLPKPKDKKPGKR